MWSPFFGCYCDYLGVEHTFNSLCGGGGWTLLLAVAPKPPSSPMGRSFHAGSSAIAMKVPIWFLMNRIGAIIGGTGWHRAELIDQFVRRFF